MAKVKMKQKMKSEGDTRSEFGYKKGYGEMGYKETPVSKQVQTASKAITKTQPKKKSKY